MKWNNHNYEIFRQIKRICSNLNVPTYARMEVQKRYFHIVKKIKYRGDRERLIGSLIYQIAKRDELHVTIDQIAEETGIERYSLLRSYKYIMKKLGWRVKPWGRRFYRLLRWLRTR